MQMNNFRDLMGSRRMDRLVNTRIKESCGVTKDDESVLRWFGHIERIRNNRNAKRMYVRNR